MFSIKKVADNSNTGSMSHNMRYKRHELFMDLISGLKTPVTVLDIGGTQEYWSNMGVDDPKIRITLLNLSHEKTTSPNFISVTGDATNLAEYADKSFDVVFSNSVIEHLFTKANQEKMAAEVMRVGRYHFIQTPNYYFPLEPHFLFPGFQFLPKGIRVSLINKFKLGHVERQEKIEDARRQIDEIQLLSPREMRILFPSSTLWKEKLFGLTKSIVMHNMKQP